MSTRSAVAASAASAASASAPSSASAAAASRLASGVASGTASGNAAIVEELQPPEDSAERQRLQREMEQQQQIEEWMISQGVSFGGMEDAIRD